MVAADKLSQCPPVSPLYVHYNPDEEIRPGITLKNKKQTVICLLGERILTT